MKKYKYDVTFSFAGEDHNYVGKVAEYLKNLGVKVFYYKDELSNLWGKNLYTYLEEIYYQKAQFCVMFISKSYEKKHWTNHERKCIQAREFESNKEYILPARFDDTVIPGVSKTTAYIDLNSYTPIQFSEIILKKLNHPAQIQLSSEKKAKNWNLYGWIFDVNGFRIPYIPLLNDWRNKKYDLSRNKIILHVDDTENEKDFISSQLEINKIKIPKDVKQSNRCAIDFYGLTPEGKLELNLKKTTYHDYYIANERLDDAIVDGGKLTFREEFGQLVMSEYGTLSSFELSNICGVGLFLQTKDNKIVMRKQSYKKRIYPGRHTFFASGTIPWGVYPDPYLEVIRKAYTEMGHQVDLKNLEMVLFGVDARKLFFQFSFVEKTEAKLKEIKRFLPKGQAVVDIFNNCRKIIEEIFKSTWEPAAIATLLTIASRNFGEDTVAKCISDCSSQWKWIKHEMKDEWDYRGNRDGDLPVMSVRYPRTNLKNKSEDYVNSIFGFIGSDVNGKHVVEIGSGNGRITERLVNVAKKVTCIECSSLMIKKSKERLGDFQNITFINSFAQDALPIKNADIIICSLVLIHNVDDSFYKDLIEKMCLTAELLYVFEDTTQGRETSPHTKLRSKERIISDFKRSKFSVFKEYRFDLYGDIISFLNFTKDHQTHYYEGSVS